MENTSSTKIHDEIGKSIYDFLETTGKVNILVGHKVSRKMRASLVFGYSIELTFSSVRLGKKFLEELVEHFRELIIGYTKGQVDVRLVKIEKTKTPVNTEQVAGMELASLWEEYNSSKSVPKKEYDNTAKITLLFVEKGLSWKNTL